MPVAPPPTSFLGALVTGDVLVRRAAADGRAVPAVTAVVFDGLCDEYDVEEELRREGLDKAVLGREAFLARAAESARRARARLASVADLLGVVVAVDGAEPADPQAARAATTAFVRLFDAGLVAQAERVVDMCPRCATVAMSPGGVAAELDGEVLTLRLPVVDGEECQPLLEVTTLAPELLPGVVAVAVPDGHPAVGAMVSVPVAATVVPVVAEPGLDRPQLLVPGHDADALEGARRLGLGAPAVLDAQGVVCAPGPLLGLARYGARAAARQLLTAEGMLARSEPAPEPAVRCAACRTVLVPVVGRHWFLALGDLEMAAADAVRDGRLVVTPASARDEMLTGAGPSREWCLSSQLWTGQPLPVARCAGCGELDVSVQTSSSCRRCMGDLAAAGGALDARFVRCVWPLSVTGWPDGGRAPGDVAAGAVLVLPADRSDDVLPMVALGLRLSGEVPFGEVTLVPPAEGDGPPLDLDALAECPPAHRVGLVGALDLDEARDLVSRLAAMPSGGVDVERLDEACAAAFDAGCPASALALIDAALAEGVPPAEAARVRALAAPFVGS